MKGGIFDLVNHDWATDGDFMRIPGSVNVYSDTVILAAANNPIPPGEAAATHTSLCDSF